MAPIQQCFTLVLFVIDLLNFVATRESEDKNELFKRVFKDLAVSLELLTHEKVDETMKYDLLMLTLESFRSIYFSKKIKAVNLINEFVTNSKQSWKKLLNVNERSVIEILSSYKKNYESYQKSLWMKGGLLKIYYIELEDQHSIKTWCKTNFEALDKKQAKDVFVKLFIKQMQSNNLLDFFAIIRNYIFENLQSSKIGNFVIYYINLINEIFNENKKNSSV